MPHLHGYGSTPLPDLHLEALPPAEHMHQPEVPSRLAGVRHILCHAKLPRQLLDLQGWLRWRVCFGRRGAISFNRSLQICAAEGKHQMLLCRRRCWTREEDI